MGLTSLQGWTFDALWEYLGEMARLILENQKMRTLTAGRRVLAEVWRVLYQHESRYSSGEAFLRAA